MPLTFQTSQLGVDTYYVTITVDPNDPNYATDEVSTAISFVTSASGS